MNIKKMFTTLSAMVVAVSMSMPSVSVFGATYSDELQDAYSWAHENSITTKATIDDANMYWAITRAEMAKMLSNWAMNVRGKTLDTSAVCEFNDTASVGGDLGEAIINSCQLGLMGQGIKSFRPYDTISRAEFGTALSRALYGNEYEGGTPYYAKHLNALKAAGIMNQIANAESTKEVRGYVMLMLMRAEGGSATSDKCNDALVKLACATDSDECPAECKASEDGEKTVVKSGDLEVTAKAAANRKILKTGTSDLDTLTFRTSEDVTISKITLERYGYSTDDSDTIKGIWLEDQDGNIIADSKTLTKDKVSLSIKKDYRNVDGEYVATIVVNTANAAGTIGFKVNDVDSTAKNLNVDNYSPYTYEVIDYTGSAVKVELKGSEKNYNYEEGESYEIARLKVSATNKDILVKGFTLTNEADKALDMKEFLDELTVTVDSKEVKATYSVNKDDELVVTFKDEVEIAMNKSALFTLSASFKDFDGYGDAVKYYIAEDSDFNAVEKKNDTRVTFDKTVTANAFNLANAKSHAFNGGKIKLSNTKLGNVDAAQASEGTVVAEGNITVTEPLSKVNFNIGANWDGAAYIDALTMIANGDEYEGKKLSTGDFSTCKAGGVYFNVWDFCKDGNNIYRVTTAWTGTASAISTDTYFVYNFKNVDIEKSGKIKFELDIKDDSNAKGKTINFTSFTKEAFAWAKYDNTNKYVSVNDVAGSISFSKVTIQAAKWALENNLTKEVEFVKNETNRKVVFEGTYTAKKWDIDLNKFAIAGNAPADNGHKITFYLSIDGEEVADTDAFAASTDDADVATTEESFSDVRVKAGESVKVKVEAEVEAYGTAGGKLPAYTVVLRGTDVNGNEDTGKGSDTVVSMQIKAKGSVTIPATSEAKTALLKAQNTVIAKFTVKPSKGNEEITLEDLVLTGTIVTGSTSYLTGSDIRVKVGGVEQDDPTVDSSNHKLTYSINEEIPSEGLVVEVILKKEQAGKVNLSLVEVNGKGFTNTYSKYLVDSLVTFTKQDEGTTSTEYTLAVEEADDAFTVKNFTVYSGCNAAGSGTAVLKTVGEVADGDTFTVMFGDKAQEICAVSYTIDGGADIDYVMIDKVNFKDYFKVNGKELAIPRA